MGSGSRNDPCMVHSMLSQINDMGFCVGDLTAAGD
jgi:hypothetical protein